jgi:hypothetical protein
LHLRTISKFFGDSTDADIEVKKPMRSLSGCILLAALSALALAGAPAEQSQASGEAWLSLIDNQNYSESWAQSGSLFRSRVSQQRWTEMVKREPLGRVISRKVLSSTTTRTLPRAPEGDYVVLRFQTSFQAKSEASETLTVMLEDGQWKAVGYYIK